MGNKEIRFCDTETHGLYCEVALFQYVGLEGEAKVKAYPSPKWMRKFVKRHHTVWYNASYDLGTISHFIPLGLDYEFDATWRILLPRAKKKNKVINFVINLAWIAVFLLPWIWRRIRGKSSGDGRSAKYNEPISWVAR